MVRQEGGMAGDDALSLFPVEPGEASRGRTVDPVSFQPLAAEPLAPLPLEQIRATRTPEHPPAAPFHKKFAASGGSRILLASIAIGTAVLTAGGMRSFYAARQTSPPVITPAPSETATALVPAAAAAIETTPGPPVETIPAATVSPRAVPSAVVAPTPRPLSSRAVNTYRGRLLVDSIPRGAMVFINQQQVGVTPLELPRHPAGSSAIWVQQEGYQRWTAGVLVPAGRTTRVTAKLENMR